MRTILPLLALLVSAPALAQVPPPIPPDTLRWDEPGRVEEPEPPELDFIGFTFFRTTTSNIAPTSGILQGQVIGRLFGRNTTDTFDEAALYTEQRFVPLFIYRPRILDGYATFRGLFKIDFTWGDVAYGVGNNAGGGFNAGQINLQTLMANVEIRPPGANWNAVVGLQRIFDNAADPNVTSLDYAQNNGYKLAYWGSQGVGLSSYIDFSQTTRARVGVYQLWENLILENDDVWLAMVDVTHRVRPLLNVGADVWYVSDRAQGAGGISILGQGLNSALAAYNGAVQLDLPRDYTADLAWAGVRANYNGGYAVDQWMADGFVMANTGLVHTDEDDIGMFGLAANARVGYKYGRTARDFISVEGLYTTGDEDGVEDDVVNSVITGNVYGSPVGIYTTGRALILFPDAQVVNRYYSAVHDISNQGYGVSGAFVNLSRDFIPNRFSGKIGAATAFANVAPEGGGRYVGTEVNAELKYNLKVFLTLGLHAAYVGLGDFYESPATTLDGEMPDNPWVVFTSLSWLMF
jgi:hypothetical protein